MRPHILRTATAARALDDGNFKQPASINPLSITARMTSLSTHDCLLATAAAAAACRVERDCPRVVIVSTARVRFDSIVIFRRYRRNVLSSSLRADVVPPNRTVQLFHRSFPPRVRTPTRVAYITLSVSLSVRRFSRFRRCRKDGHILLTLHPSRRLVLDT